MKQMKTLLLVIILITFSFISLGCGTALNFSAPPDVEVRSIKVTNDEIRFDFTPYQSGKLSFTINHESDSGSVKITSKHNHIFNVRAGEDYDIKVKHDLHQGSWGKCIVAWYE